MPLTPGSDAAMVIGRSYGHSFCCLRGLVRPVKGWSGDGVLAAVDLFEDLGGEQVLADRSATGGDRGDGLGNLLVRHPEQPVCLGVVALDQQVGSVVLQRLLL